MISQNHEIWNTSWIKAWKKASMEIVKSNQSNDIWAFYIDFGNILAFFHSLYQANFHEVNTMRPPRNLQNICVQIYLLFWNSAQLYWKLHLIQEHFQFDPNNWLKILMDYSLDFWLVFLEISTMLNQLPKPKVSSWFSAPHNMIYTWTGIFSV